MSLLFDHLVIKVHNLQQAVQSFTAAGFVVTNGGTHKGGYSENALIFFADGSFIELLAMKKGLKPFFLRLYSKTRGFMALKYSRKWGLFHRFYDRALTLPEGITDFCLLTDDLKSQLQRIDREGLFVTRPIAASRKRPDGTTLSWQMASTLLTELPFLRGPYSPDLPPPAAATAHANGIMGIKSVTMLALDFKEMVKNLAIVLDQEPQNLEESREKEASFQMGNAQLHLKKSSDHDTLVKQLRGKGLGVYAVEWTHAAGGERPGERLPALHGFVVLEPKSSKLEVGE